MHQTNYFTDVNDNYAVYNISDDDLQHCTHCIINNGNPMNSKSIKMPKTKLITAQYVIERYESRNNKVYKNLKDTFENLLPNNSKMTLYAASYGIGIFRVYNPDANKQITAMRKILDDNNIKYRTEYSKANWVYRFVISKESGNIAKLKSIKN